MRCLALVMVMMSAAQCSAQEGHFYASTTDDTTWEELFEYSSTPDDPQTTTDAPLLAADAACPAGSYCPPGFSACILCETGTYAAAGLATACRQCPAGWYGAADGATQCVQCPAGRFSFFSGSSVCSSCPAWTGSAVGMAACATCHNASTGCSYADGSACPMCGSACAQCNAGYYSDGVSGDRCLGCGPGKYLPGKGAPSSGSCTDCFSGTYTRPTSTGLSACLQCSVGMPLPQNAYYLGDGFDPLLCKWACEAGFQTVSASPDRGGATWSSLSASYAKQGFSDASIVEMIRFRSDYCCDTSKVTAGRWRVGCTKYSAGTVADCQAVENGQFVLASADSLNRCDDWVCNAGYYKLSGGCVPQPVCGAGSTYARDGGGQLIAQSGVYSCAACPVCVDGSETAASCNSTHAAVCRMCGGARPYSVGGGACVQYPPVGFRGAKTTLGSGLAWGARPVLTSDNRPFVWAPGTVLYSYVACADAGYGREFAGGDAVCDLATDSYCNQCNTQCAPWKRSTGLGWYGGATCVGCQYDPLLCAGDQFLDMGVCGPVSPPACAPCPSELPVANQVGWLNPRDAKFDGQFPCRVLCAAGYSEVDGRCAFCQNLPSNVILVSGCDWRCKQGYLQSGSQCSACPAPSDCAAGSYPDYQGSSNVCLTCLPCQRPSNAVLLTAGTFGVASSCVFRCEAGYYRSGDLCVACTQRACALGQTFLTACTGAADSKCTACRACSVGERVVSACTASNNTLCAACDPTLKPDNAAWAAAGCSAWACVAGFWNDGGVCRKCSVQKDCGLGSTLLAVSAVCGKCGACPPLLSGECYNGDQYCGTTRACVQINSAPPSSTPSGRVSSPPQSSGRVSSPPQSTGSVPSPPQSSGSVPSPPQSTGSVPAAYASLVSLTIKPDARISAGLLASLARNVSMAVCPAVSGFCNVSVLAVTANNATAFCTAGVCPGYARRLLGAAVTVVDVGVVTQTPILDVSLGLSSLEAVDDASLLPNSPVANLASVEGSQAFLALVRSGYTVVLVAQPTGNTAVNLAAAAVVVVLILAGAAALQLRRAPRRGVLVSGDGQQAEAQFAFLNNIRITRENLSSNLKSA